MPKVDRKETIQVVTNELSKYFSSTDIRDRHPSKWIVPIGGSFFDEREIAAVLDCYLRGALSMQDKVSEFEKAFAGYIGQKHGIAVNSGSSANLVALSVLVEAGELKAGDEVIVPATTFITVATPIVQLGLVPVYVDVDSNTFNLDPLEFERAIVPGKTKAVMVVHTLGLAADLGKILPIARKHSLKVIEDCCEAHGTEYEGKKVGSFGDFATFSFYVAHHITTGEGGMVLTSSKEYDEIAREVKEFGRKVYDVPRYGYTDERLDQFDERYVFDRLGYNLRMSDIQASFGLVQLERLDELNKKRIAVARYFGEHLSDTVKEHIQLPQQYEDNTHTYYAYAFKINNDSRFDRRTTALHLEENNIETRAIFCGTMPDQPGLANVSGRSYGDLSASRSVRDRAFFIGSHPGLRDQDLEHAVNVINNYFDNAE